MNIKSKDEKSGFFKRLKEGLTKTHKSVIRRIDEITFGKKEISKDLIKSLEEILITSDLGVSTVQSLMEKIRLKVDRKELQQPDKIRSALKEEILSILSRNEQPLVIQNNHKPFTILTVGVNGTGKTTTIAKLANIFKDKGYSVLLAAADTFRAAAIDQLEIWGGRVGCNVIKHKQGSDPSAVAFDSLKSALANNIDVLIIDTAGRLHTKAPLMEEIKKVSRIIGRELPGAPHETLLVLDSTTGQNAISQAKFFKEAVNISGIALTKLDGSAKGGVIVGISEIMKIPIRFIGVGEKIDDLREFNAKDFVDALFDE
jgi:fused signal recognition particle receptor